MDKNSFEKGKMKKKIYINPFFITTGAPCKDGGLEHLFGESGRGCRIEFTDAMSVSPNRGVPSMAVNLVE